MKPDDEHPIPDYIEVGVEYAVSEHGELLERDYIRSYSPFVPIV
jgi:hypothetical protein